MRNKSTFTGNFSLENLVCKICDHKVTSPANFGNHLKLHRISTKDYYDKYLKKENEGICPITNKETKFISITKGYKTHFNHEAILQDPKTRKKISENSQKALLKKYGVHSAQLILESKEKTKITFEKKYGGRGNKSKIIQEKVKKTNLERYGCEFPTSNEQVKERTKNTFIKNFGGFTFQVEELSDKVKKTNLERYGTEKASKNEQIKKKISESHLELYKTEEGNKIKKQRENTNLIRYNGTGTGSEVINEKIKQTILERYAVENPQQNLEIQTNTIFINLERYDSPYTITSKKLLQEKYGIDHITELEWVVEKQKVNRKKSNIEKYGVINISQLPWVQEKVKNTFLEKYGTQNPFEIYLKNINSLELKVILSDHKEHYCLSKLEKTFFNYCINNNIEIYKGDVIQYKFDNKLRNYYSDFKIKENGKFQLIEIKGRHKWYKEQLDTGKLEAKTLATQIYSQFMGYMPFKILMQEQIKENKIKEIEEFTESKIINSALKGEF